MIILSFLLFAIFFPLNVWHFRKRKIPLYSTATILALVHLLAGGLAFYLIPIVSIFVFMGVEIYIRELSKEDKDILEKRYEEEEKEVNEKIEKSQKSYEKLYCLSTYTVEMEWEYRDALKLLDENKIWYYVRNGLITSILIQENDAERAKALLGITEDQIIY